MYDAYYEKINGNLQRVFVAQKQRSCDAKKKNVCRHLELSQALSLHPFIHLSTDRPRVAYNDLFISSLKGWRGSIRGYQCYH